MKRFQKNDSSAQLFLLTMSVLNSTDLSKLNKKSVKLVFGYIRKAQQLLPNSHSYFIINQLIQHLCLTYYHLEHPRWDRKNHGKGVTFINDHRVNIKGSDYTTSGSICIADYIVDKENLDSFEWTIIAHKLSGNFWFGFIEANSISKQHWDEWLCESFKDTNCAMGGSEGFTNANIFGECKTKSSFECEHMNHGDEFRFCADMKKKEICVYHNDKCLGVLWENIYDQFIPAVSSYVWECEYTIK